MADATTPDDVLSFWLGELDSSGCATAEVSARWFEKSDAFDAEVRRRFDATHRTILAGEREGWLETPRGRLAYILVLDQLQRNMHRGTPRMYEGDARAARVAVEGIDAGCEEGLAYHERYFLFMPLMHAEDVTLQERCVALFEGLGGAFPEHAERAARGVDYAQRHRDIVRRFGRFPHRNEILGRESTAEERAFLGEPDSSF